MRRIDVIREPLVRARLVTSMMGRDGGMSHFVDILTLADRLIAITARTLVMMLLDRREDIITTAITTIVVMVVAILSPSHAWTQPLLRLFDTAIGIGVGVGCKWLASLAFSRLRRGSSEARAREN
jgi:uncharacterized membrane protein YccC